MNKRGLKRRDGRDVRWRGVGVVVAASAVLSGCSPGDAPAKDEPVETVRSALDCGSIQPNDTGPDVKQIAELSKDVVKAYFGDSFSAEDAIQIAIDILGLGGGASVDAQIDASNEKMFCLVQTLDWRIQQLDYNNLQYAPVAAAWMTAQTVGFPRLSAHDAGSQTATIASGGLPMFQRLYAPGDHATDGNGPLAPYTGLPLWKDTVGNYDPAHDDNYVFDWRIGLPRFMRLLSARIAMIGMMDPNFATNGQWNPELGDGTAEWPGYRGVLTARLQKMIEGVRCGFKDRTRPVGGSYSTYDHTDVACADVNTGLNAMTTYVRPDGANCGSQYWLPFLYSCLGGLPSTNDITAVQDGLRRQVLKQMPIFEVQAAIDALYLYTHPAPDLTQGLGRIPLAANPGLCLDVPWGDPTPGNTLQIYDCHGGTAQQFSYDRATETIRNTALDRCIQVRPAFVFNFPEPIGTIVVDNLAQMATAEIANCDGARPDRQRWTYDPQGGIIRSALNTVLDVQWGNLQAGTPVWLADYNGSGAQVWRADHSNTYCGGICQPACNAQCAGAGQGTGSCIGGCMGGCMGYCMTTWP